MTQTPITISELPNYSSVLGTDRIPVDRLGAAVTAGAFVVDQAYQIVTVGSTNFVAIGAASNTVGLYFVATGAGSGTGTAAPINTGDAPLSAIAALLGGDPAGTAAAAVAAHEAAADPHPTYSTAAELAAAVAAHAAAADPHPTYSTAAELAAAVAAHEAAADPHPTYTTAAELAAAIAGVSGQTQTVTIAVRNNTGSTIGKGVPVYVTGSSGTAVTIAPADASAEATAAETLGLTTASIPNNTDGTVIAVGLLDGLNTAALTEGQIVWLSETTGGLTTTRPTQPAHGVVVGYCVKQGSGTSGIVYVKVDNGLELGELHDVLVTGAIAGVSFLQLAADGLWKPKTITAADVGALPRTIEMVDVAYAATINIDFAANNGKTLIVGTLTGPLTFTFSNIAQGRNVSVDLLCDSTSRTLTFPAATPFLGPKPSSIAASKAATLTLECRRAGTTDASVRAGYSVQP